MKRFTVEEVQALVGEAFKVTEEDEGVRVFRERGYNEIARDMLCIPKIMLAALHLKLHPSQFQDESTYEDSRSCGSSWTGEYGSEGIEFNVLFRWERQ